MIRVLVADDHRLVRRGIKEILGVTHDIVVVNDCASAEEVEAALNLALPDVLILDMAMPGLSGVELIRHLMKRFPSLRILVLSMHNESQFVARALREGARGYVTKDAETETLLQAVRKVASDGKFIDPALVQAMVFHESEVENTPNEKLTEREFQVLRLVVAGKSLNAIAETLHLSPKTISSHKTRIMLKLNINNNVDLVRYAMRHDIA
jgi:DNA-binding NarL/FixJ family response regulator